MRELFSELKDYARHGLGQAVAAFVGLIAFCAMIAIYDPRPAVPSAQTKTAPTTTGSISPPPKSQVTKPKENAHVKCKQAQPPADVLAARKETADSNLKKCFNDYMESPLTQRRFEWLAKEHCADKTLRVEQAAAAVGACDHLKP